jgi:hydroxyacylglutathione hydrolase
VHPRRPRQFNGASWFFEAAALALCNALLAASTQSQYIWPMLWRESRPVGPLQCNCTILADTESGEALIIDPGDEVPRLLATLQEKKWTLRGIVHTHAHIDHIGGATELARLTGATTYLHPDDTFLYELLPFQAQLLGLAPPGPTVPMDRPLSDAMGVHFGEFELGVMHTPGHTPGSTCFYLDGAALCFSGDTLFSGSVGRTDLPGGDAAALRRSIRERLYTLPPDVEVICGHGPSTRIGHERRSNPYVRG